MYYPEYLRNKNYDYSKMLKLMGGHGDGWKYRNQKVFSWLCYREQEQTDISQPNLLLASHQPLDPSWPSFPSPLSTQTDRFVGRGWWESGVISLPPPLSFPPVFLLFRGQVRQTVQGLLVILPPAPPAPLCGREEEMIESKREGKCGGSTPANLSLPFASCWDYLLVGLGGRNKEKRAGDIMRFNRRGRKQ